jgi:hypothetical protein
MKPDKSRLGSKKLVKFKDLLKAGILLGIITTMGITRADLISVGDKERFSLDANVNLDWHNPATPWFAPVEIVMTAGGYKLTFTSEVAGMTAWNAWPDNGWDYWVGNMCIFSSYDGSTLLSVPVVGSGSSQAEAFAYASTLTFEFDVPTDQSGLAVIMDYDTNNDGGLTFYIEKISDGQKDTDGDGLLDDWEENGYDIDKDGTIDLDLPALGADPMHKDLFVEVDAMVGRAPTKAALDRVVAAFKVAPNILVDNPDGKDGVTLHILLDETDIPLADWPNAFNDFDVVKKNRFGTKNERNNTPNWLTSKIREAKGNVYRYCIFANTHSGGNSSGLAEMPGDDFMVTLGGSDWKTPGGTENQKIGTFMHELGHNLNLDHGGGDNIHFKPNYHSVMNYHWQYPREGYIGWKPDYSREVLPPLNELNLVEINGIGGTPGNVLRVGPLPYVYVNENGPVDWNRDNNDPPWETGVIADINYIRHKPAGKPGGPSPGQVLTGFCDWPALWYKLSGHPHFKDGFHDETTIHHEMTSEMYRELFETIAIELDFDPDVLNLARQGRTVTAYIELSEEFDVGQINVSSILLNASVPALSNPVEIGDYNEDGIPDLMVKFSMQQVSELLEPGEQVITLSGQLDDGTQFAGTDTIWVFDSRNDEAVESEPELILHQEFITELEEDLQPMDDDLVSADSDEEFDLKEAIGFMLFEFDETIRELGPESFDNEGSALELTCNIDDLFTMLNEGMYVESLILLENDILQRMNGCANIGEPDEDDWIMSVEGQALLYPLLIQTIELVENLI